MLVITKAKLYPTEFLSTCSPGLLPTQDELCIRNCQVTSDCARGQVCDSVYEICTCTAFSGCGPGYACYTNNSTMVKQGLGRCYCDVSLTGNPYACNAAGTGGSCQIGSYKSDLSVSLTPVFFSKKGGSVTDADGQELQLDPGDSLRGKVLFKKLTQTNRTLTQSSEAQAIPGFCVCTAGKYGPNCDDIVDTNVQDCGTHGVKFCPVDSKRDVVSHPLIKLNGMEFALCDDNDRRSGLCRLQLCNEKAVTTCACEPFWTTDNVYNKCEVPNNNKHYCSSQGTYDGVSCTCFDGYYDIDCSETGDQFCHGAIPTAPQQCQDCVSDQWGPRYPERAVGPYCNLRYTNGLECNGLGYARDFSRAEQLLYLPTGFFSDRFFSASDVPVTLPCVIGLALGVTNCLQVGFDYTLVENYAALRTWWKELHSTCTCFVGAYPSHGSCSTQACQAWHTLDLSDDAVHQTPNDELCGGLARGVCLDATCICREGFSGPACEQVYCLHARGAVCAGNGECDRETNLCVCQERFYGLACEHYADEVRDQTRGQPLYSRPASELYDFTQIIEQKIL